ncbi:MAG: CAP domain-containing protein [Acidobacteria bacterium]|nr:MAG: CAP domain-containing protein [Acidobacteriota bacterium]
MIGPRRIPALAARRALAVPAVLVAFVAGTPARPIPPRPLDDLAGAVLERIDAARRHRGVEALRSDDTLRAAARERALELARLAHRERLRHPARPGRWLALAGLPRAGRDVEKVLLLRDVDDPVAESLRLLRALEDTWALALSPRTRAGAVGAARAPDGWIVVVVALAAAPADAFTPRAGGLFDDRELAALADGIAAAVDAARRQRGVPALQRDPRLDAVAGGHARDLARRGVLDHRGADGATLGDRLQRAGIGYRVASENLALIEGTLDPVEEAVSGWLASPGHRRNLLDETVERTGIGTAQDDEGRLYVVQVFVASPPGGAPRES